MRRSAYTLFEVILVMGILVVAGFISLPLLKPMLTSNHLRAASDVVLSRWTEARTRAVADGRAYRFAIMENTGKYKIAPDAGEFWGEAGDGFAETDTPPWVKEGTLPGNVRFLTAESTPLADQQAPSNNPGAPANPSNAGSNQASGSSGGWTRVVTFLPTGAAHEDVEISFGGAGGGSALTLKLRGATGTVIAAEGN